MHGEVERTPPSRAFRQAGQSCEHPGGHVGVWTPRAALFDLLRRGHDRRTGQPGREPLPDRASQHAARLPATASPSRPRTDGPYAATRRRPVPGRRALRTPVRSGRGGRELSIRTARRRARPRPSGSRSRLSEGRSGPPPGSADTRPVPTPIRCGGGTCADGSPRAVRGGRSAERREHGLGDRVGRDAGHARRMQDPPARRGLEPAARGCTPGRAVPRDAGGGAGRTPGCRGRRGRRSASPRRRPGATPRCRRPPRRGRGRAGRRGRRPTAARRSRRPCPGSRGTACSTSGRSRAVPATRAGNRRRPRSRRATRPQRAGGQFFTGHPIGVQHHPGSGTPAASSTAAASARSAAVGTIVPSRAGSGGSVRAAELRHGRGEQPTGGLGDREVRGGRGSARVRIRQGLRGREPDPDGDTGGRAQRPGRRIVGPRQHGEVVRPAQRRPAARSPRRRTRPTRDPGRGTRPRSRGRGAGSGGRPPRPGARPRMSRPRRGPRIAARRPRAGSPPRRPGGRGAPRGCAAAAAACPGRRRHHGDGRRWPPSPTPVQPPGSSPATPLGTGPDPGTASAPPVRLVSGALRTVHRAIPGRRRTSRACKLSPANLRADHERRRARLAGRVPRDHAASDRGDGSRRWP